MTEAADYVAAHRDDLLRDLHDFLRIPGISAQPEHDADVARSARWLADAFRRTGFPTVEVWTGDGLPAVYAEWPSDDAAAPTVLVYGHHDVQPVDPLDLWHTDPFEPTVDGPVLRARGASDDKGQVLFHLLGVRAHLAALNRTAPAVSLKFLIEGEEESGSPHFDQLLARRVDRLGCDVVVITDTGMISPDRPSTVVGMRGLVGGELHVHGPDVDLHSGVFGGAVRNPLTEMAQLLAALHEPSGRIAVPGFYDDLVELSDAERAMLGKAPFDEAEFLRVTASRATHGEAGFSTVERIGARPTAEINGFWGGYTGPGGKTIIPTDAYAKLSFRLVAGQRPEKIMAAVSDFIDANTPDGIVARITWGGAVAPCNVPTDTPAYAALTSAIRSAFGSTEVWPVREGGSGPEAAIQEALGVPMVFLGVGLPDDRIHAPNEKVTLEMLYRGAHAAALLWEEFARLGRAGIAGSAGPAG
jgi:acetylornithine deacetylase/succinyl-diaminopimelate desuccinylase-like protein